MSPSQPHRAKESTQLKKLIERITRRGAGSAPDGAVAPPEIPEGGLPMETEPGATTETPVPKPPPDLPLFFMLSHLDDDGPVRLDGVKLGVCEVMGLEIDEPKLGAFTGALNALDFPAQLLVRQHPPRPGHGLREQAATVPAGGPAPADQGRQRVAPPPASPTLRPATASSTGASTPCARPPGMDDLRGLLARAGLAVHPAPRPPASNVPRVGRPGRLPLRVRRGEAHRGGDQTAARVRVGDRLVSLPSPGQMAPLPGPRLPPGAHGGWSPDGPVRPRRPDTGGAGGQDP